MNGRFNRVAIKTWQNDLTRIPHELSALNASILQDQAASKAVLERVEKEARVFIRPIAANIDALESQIAILENNQEIAEQKQIKANQLAISSGTQPELAKVSSALSAKTNAVEAIKNLQRIKTAQDVMQTYPGMIASLSSAASQLSSSMAAENNLATSISYQINNLRTEISSLEQEEALDRQRHAIANAHAFEHHHHHDHHDHHYGHHHGHHHHDDHQPSLFVSLLGAAASAGEFVIDIGRSNRLAAKRAELQRQLSQQSSHQNAASRLSQQYNTKNQELSRYQRELSQQQAWLVNIDYAQQGLAQNSASSQLAYDLSQREIEKSDLERQRYALQNKIERADDAAISAQRVVTNLEKSNAQLLSSVGPHGGNNNLENLNQQLDEARTSREPYDVTERKYLTEDAQYVANIAAARRNILRLTDLQNRQLANHFLTSLRDNPQGLATDFVTRYTNAVTTFDAEHPADQSAAEQLALVDMKNDVAYILALQNSSNSSAEGVEGQPQEEKHEDDGLLHHPARVKLYQLCGLLQAKAAAIQAAEGNASSPLVAKLNAVTERFPLDQTETVAEYQKLARPQATAEDLTQLAVDAFNAALQGLRQAADNTRTDVKELRKLAETANALANKIEENNSHVAFNILFYTKMLVAAKALLLKPSSPTLRNDFETLVKLDKLGLANNCKRGTGVAFLFLGAATLATSVLAELGYIHGVPETAKKAGFGVGGAGVAYGLWSMFSGRQQGSVKASHNFTDAANHVPSTLLVLQKQQPASAAVQRSNSLGSGLGVPGALFTPAPVVVVQSSQANDPGYTPSTDSRESFQYIMQSPLLNTDPSAPPPEYSERSTGYSPSHR